MILPDVNLLVYSVDSASDHHARAREWWDGMLSSSEQIGLSYPSLLGFLRITTHPRIFARPLSIEDAVLRVESWLAQPNAVLLVPGQRHWVILARLLRSVGVGANLTTDAHLAAMAIEHGYTLYSNDTDFSRFQGLQWEHPLTQPGLKS